MPLIRNKFEATLEILSDFCYIQDVGFTLRSVCIFSKMLSLQSLRC